MEDQGNINFKRISKAIEFIQANFKMQPNLKEIADEVHLSPAHFQRIFTEWAGTSPKNFLQYISVEYAKKILKADQLTLFDAAYDMGLSSTSRLHDLFIKIEGMSPAEYKNEGKNLLIQYSFSDSPFGRVLIASTTKGICYLAFHDQDEEGIESLINKFPKASFVQQVNRMQLDALAIFREDWDHISEIKLHLKGSEFQIRVWESLLKIPMGALSTYGELATEIGKPTAARAVGTAIGSNPVAFLIPCHRVIQSSGTFGGYRWGATRKTAIIGWEANKPKLGMP